MFSIEEFKHTYTPKSTTTTTQTIEINQWRTQQGEKWLLLGKSGSGKTTILQALAGLLTPTQGHISVAEQSLKSLSGSSLDAFRANNIGIIFQKIHFIHTISILDNLLLTQFLAGNKKDKKYCLERLEGVFIAHKAHHQPKELSQGELQRASVVRALLNTPKILLADEPTASLDDENAQKVIQLLINQADECGSTLLIATHDQRVKPFFELKYEM